MDEVDLAQKELDLQLEAIFANLKKKQENAAALLSADNCAECGELIPSERQIAVPGCQLCIGCAEKFEQLAMRKKI